MNTNFGGCGCNQMQDGGCGCEMKGGKKVLVGPRGGKFIYKICNGKKTKIYIKND